MSLLPIILGVDRLASVGKGISVSKEDPVYVALKIATHERQDFTCQFCGFKAPKYQEIVFRDGNHANHAESNVNTACIFCHQCFHLEQVGAMNSGTLIYLPEMTQAELNHVMRAIYVARRTQGPIADAARAGLAAVTGRREEAKKRLGTDSPSVLAATMLDLMDGRSYKMRSKKLDGIRLMPADRRIVLDEELEFDQFPQILAHWRSRHGPYGSMLPPTWPQLFRTVQAA